VMRRTIVVCGALLFVTGAPAAGQMHEHHKHKVTMVGNMHSYPDLDRAGAENVRRARHLKNASRATAHRFDTMAKARALGYHSSHAKLPGFVHARKNGHGFWGSVFDADAPQSLVFWCTRHDHCTLTTYMYRAPAGRPPSTWRRLLQWHRHGDETTTWMTHVWLVPNTRKAFATCAPWSALERALGVKQPRRYAYHMTDRPCPEEDSMPMGDM
jgi:hypothetical protein